MLFHTYSVAKRQNVGENYSTKPTKTVSFESCRPWCTWWHSIYLLYFFC